MDKSKLNKILKQKFDGIARATINLFGEQEEKLLLTYTNSLKRVQKLMDEVYNKFGDKPSITELRKFNRLALIEKNLIDLVKGLENEVVIYLSKQNKYALLTGKQDVADIINKVAGVEFVPTKLNKKQIELYLSDNLWYDSLKETSVKLVNDIKHNFETILRANAREEVIGGAMEGTSLRELSKIIAERFGVSLSRAKVIAQTESHKFYNIGRNDSINEAISKSVRIFGVKAYKVWRHNAIGEPRPEHLKADGQKADGEGYFYVGGERLQAPGLGTDPANNINCHCTVDFIVE